MTDASSSGAADVPGWPVFEARYAAPRRLRTRAAGTPFWVQTVENRLVVTTTSGHLRIIGLDLLTRCWGPIGRNEPVTRWKALSASNSSYIAAIYDDTIEYLEDRAIDSGTDRGLPKRESHGSDVKVVVEGVPRTAWSSAADGLRPGNVSVELETLRIKLGARDQLILDLQGELRMLRGNLPPALEEDRHRAVEAQTRQALQVAEAALRAAQVDMASGQGENQRLTSELKTMQSRLEAAQRIKDRAVERAAAMQGERPADEGPAPDVTLASARVEIQRLSSQLKTMQSRLDAAERIRDRALERAAAAEELAAVSGNASTATPQQDLRSIEVNLDVGKLRFSSTSHLPTEVARALDLSGTSVFKNADQAILDSRRALEEIIGQLFTRALGRSPHGLRVADMMSDLRGHPAIPDSDWHQAKNLYARSSAVVHDRGGTARLALWIWLGTYQLAELLGAPAPHDAS